MAGPGIGTTGALSLSAVSRHPSLHPLTVATNDHLSNFIFELNTLRIIVFPITNESSSQVYRGCWWLAGGVWMLVGLVAAVPGKGTVMAAAAGAGLGLGW